MAIDGLCVVKNYNAKVSFNMAIVGDTIVVNVPHIGLSKDSARGFALEQFARQQGYPSFAEWSVHCFDQALQISGEIRESDSIEVNLEDSEEAGLLLRTFGYEVVLHLRKIDGQHSTMPSS